MKTANTAAILLLTAFLSGCAAVKECRTYAKPDPVPAVQGGEVNAQMTEVHYTACKHSDGKWYSHQRDPLESFWNMITTLID